MSRSCSGSPASGSQSSPVGSYVGVNNQSLLDEFPELLVIFLDLLALHGLFQYGLLVYPTFVT